MLIRTLACIGALALALAAGCQRSEKKSKPGAPAHTPQSDAELDQALATIDGVTITVREFQERINRQSPYVRGRYTSLENKKEFLSNLIRFEVLAIEAVRRGLDKDPDAVRAMKQVMIQKLMKEEFETNLTPESITEADMRAYYDQNQNQYNKPEEVRVAAILVKSRRSADRVAKLALGEQGKTPTGFRALVAEHSADETTRARSGDLRYFSANNKGIPRQVIDAAFKLTRTGEVAGPIDAGGGNFYIIKQTGRRQAVTKEFDSVKLQIRNRLYRDKRKRAQRDFIGGLKKKSKIEIFEGNLKKVRVDTSRSSSGAGGHGGTAPAMPAPGSVAAPK